MGEPSLQPYRWNFKTTEKNFSRACFRYTLWIKRHDTVHIAPQRDLILDGPLKSIVTMSLSVCSAGRLAPAETAPFLPPQTSPFQRNCKKSSSLSAVAQDPTESLVLWCGWLCLSPLFTLLCTAYSFLISWRHCRSFSFLLCCWPCSMTTLDAPSPDFHDPFLWTRILSSIQRLRLFFFLSCPKDKLTRLRLISSAEISRQLHIDSVV